MKGWALLDDCPVGRSSDWCEIGLNQRIRLPPRGGTVTPHGNNDVNDASRVDEFTKLVEYVGTVLWPKQPVKCVRSIVRPVEGNDDFTPYVGYEARRKGDGAKNVMFSFSGPAICDTEMIADALTDHFGHFDPAPTANAQ